MDIIKQGILPPKELEKILQEKEKVNYKDKSEVASLYGKDKPTIKRDVRNGKIFFPSSLQARKTYNILQSLIISEYIGSNFDLTNIASFQYAYYGVGGKFTWHTDLIYDMRHQLFRSFTFSCNLSDADNYEGGELQVLHEDKTLQLGREKGSYIIFPSFLPHCVNTVTKGEREAMVTWTQSPASEISMLRSYYKEKYGKIPDLPRAH